MKKYIAFFIALSLLAMTALTGCGKAETRESTDTAPTATAAPVTDDGQWHGLGGCYKLERSGASGDYFRMKSFGGKVILMAFDGLYDENGNAVSLNFYKDYAVVADGIWCVREQEMVDGKYVRDCYMVKLGFDGQELSHFDISVAADYFAIGGDGRLFTYDAVDNKLGCFSQDGTEMGLADLSAAKVEPFSAKLMAGGDGSIWLLNKAGKTDSEMTLYPLDTETMVLGSGYTLPADAIEIYTGTAEHTFLLKTNSELAYYEPESGEMETILLWDECGFIPGELASFISGGEGFLCLTATGLARVLPAQPGEIKINTKLTMGVTSPYVGEDLAARFNAQSEGYSVEVVDYSDGGALSMEDAQKKLNTELISGGGPDMIYCYDTSDYRGGVLMDIYPLLDADPTVSREDFYLLGAMERDGKLYQVPASIAIETFGALPEKVGDKTGWTWDEYFAMEKTLPPDGMMYDFLRSDFFLNTSLALYAPGAIDWENGTCNFDTPEFVRILQAALDGYDPDCPEENPHFFDEVNLWMNQGKVILRYAYIIEPESISQDESAIGRELNYVGWPTPDGSCGSVASVSGPVICANTDAVEGCWQFIKFAMETPNIYKPMLEEHLAEATAPKSSGEAPAMTQRQAQVYKTLLESITACTSEDNTLNDIVINECAAMFAGDKTPEETAKIIQSKLSIYVAERGQ